MRAGGLLRSFLSQAQTQHSGTLEKDRAGWNPGALFQASYSSPLALGPHHSHTPDDLFLFLLAPFPIFSSQIREDGTGLGQVRGQRSVKRRQRGIRTVIGGGAGRRNPRQGAWRVIQGLGGGQPLTTPLLQLSFSPPELLLPPDLAELQEVDEGLQQPDAEAAATAAVGAGRGGRRSGAQLRTAFFGAEGDGAVLGAGDRPAGTAVLGADGGSREPGIRIVVDEPAKAEQLHDKRGQEHKQQRYEAEVGVLTLQVIGGPPATGPWRRRRRTRAAGAPSTR